MRLISFVSRNGQSGYGAQINDQQVAHLSAVLGHRYNDLKSLLASGLEEAQAALNLAPVLSTHEIHLLPVIPNPNKIICVGLNYETHRVETGRPKEAHPSIFTRFASSQIAAGDPIIRPRVSTALDYEGELALIIGTLKRPTRLIILPATPATTTRRFATGNVIHTSSHQARTLSEQGHSAPGW